MNFENVMTIRLLLTGGTIDKQYNEIDGELIFTQSGIGDMLTQGRARLDISLETVMLKDSLDIDDNDRQQILASCLACDESRIVITHGTDTMVETSQVLAAGIKDKTIVLLGAMVPYQYKNSDALFNLGCAIAAVQTLSNGVYITMNGKVFNYDEVLKNKKLGEFQSR
ncbi:MAG: asparaginase domain-containing protein [Gammaproteobacteria bacterium]